MDTTLKRIAQFKAIQRRRLMNEDNVKRNECTITKNVNNTKQTKSETTDKNKRWLVKENNIPFHPLLNINDKNIKYE